MRIEKVKDVCGGRAVIKNTRFTVWRLVSLHMDGMSDSEMLTECSDISPEDLTDAWKYYQENKQEIDNAIKEHTLDDK